MKHDHPGCAYCPPTVRACRKGESRERGPDVCPSKVDEEGIAKAWGEYADPEVRRIARVSAEVESEGYCQWSRVEEICVFAHKMGFTKIGIACCISFVDHARTLSRILESHGFKVASVVCKHGDFDKERIGLRDDQKLRPGQHESMCNPVSQAILLNRAGCELNVVMGLCVGHDSLFFRRAKGLVTVLVVKDRVLAHNPIGALNLADSYYSRVWGRHPPDRAPTTPSKASKRR